MAGFEKYSEIARLLSKAVRGQLTEEERTALEKWREESPGNDLLYRRIMTPEFIFSKSKRWDEADIATAYLDVQRRCERRSRQHRLYRISAVAASVLLVVGIGLYRFMPADRAGHEIVAETILPGNAKAELILAGGERILLGGPVVDSVVLQPGAEIHTTEEHLSYVGRERIEEIQYNRLQVPRGGEYSVTLQDGTVVFLNSASELRYPVRFAGARRKVFLTGEAYFQVKKDPEHPFIVVTGEAEIEVLGTGFNVYSYREEGRIETTLVEGAVRFSVAGQVVVLAPGEQGVAEAGGKLRKKKVDVYPYVAWKDGQFVFRKRSLGEVMHILSRWYNVDVVFTNEALKEISFTGNLKRYDDFGHIVDMLAMTGGIRFEVKGRTIYIAGK